jgi:hypothetical protein
MKKLLALLFLVAIFLTPAIYSAKAEYNFIKDSGVNDLGNKAGYTTVSSASEANSPEYYVGLILNILFSFLGIIFLVLIVYSGVLWMTAQGNTSQIEKAKDTIIKAVVGLTIVILAYATTFFILNMFYPQISASNITS